MEAASAGGVATTAPPSSSSDPQPSHAHLRKRSVGGAPMAGILGEEEEEPVGAELQNDDDTDYTDCEVGVVAREGVSQRAGADRRVEQSREGSSDVSIQSPTNSVIPEPLERAQEEGSGHPEAPPREGEDKSEGRGHADSVITGMVADDNDQVDSGGILSRLLGLFDTWHQTCTHMHTHLHTQPAHTPAHTHLHIHIMVEHLLYVDLFMSVNL